jgi:2-methylisocitrate lyase-like PEP mutase family enzyme
MVSSTGFFPYLFNSLTAQHIAAIDWCAERCATLKIGLLSDTSCLKYGITSVGSVTQRISILKSLYPGAEIQVSDDIFFLDVLATLPKSSPVFHGDKYIQVNGKNYKNEFISNVAALKLKYTEFKSERLLDINTQNDEMQYKNSITAALSTNIPILGLDIYDYVSALSVRNGFNSSSIGVQGAFWGGSLSYSANMLRSDTEFFSLPQRLDYYSKIREAIGYFPIIVDGDTGGSMTNLALSIKQAVVQKIDAIVLEDKTGSKFNSLVEDMGVHQLASLDSFIEKLLCIKEQSEGQIIPIARLEGLIVGNSTVEVASRICRIQDSGATNTFMIHTKKDTLEQILEVKQLVNNETEGAKFMIVPQNILNYTMQEYFDLGFSIVIYPNQLLRSSVHALEAIVEKLLSNRPLSETGDAMVGIERIINMEQYC